MTVHRDLQLLVPKQWAKANVIYDQIGQPLLLNPNKFSDWTRETANAKKCIWDPQSDYIIFGAREDADHSLWFTGRPRLGYTQMMLVYQIQLVQEPTRDTDRWLCGLLPRDRDLGLRDRKTLPPGVEYDSLTYMIMSSDRLVIQNNEEQTDYPCNFLNDRVAFLHAPAGAIFHIYHLYGLEI